MWTVIFFVSIALVCVLCAISTVINARDAYQGLESQRRRLTSIESGMQSIITSHESWQEVVADLANSMKMAKVRRGLKSNTSSANGEPDPKSDPEGWRTWKNAQLRAGQFNQ